MTCTRLYIIPCRMLDGMVSTVYCELYPDYPLSTKEYIKAVEITARVLAYYFGITDSIPVEALDNSEIRYFTNEISNTVEDYLGVIWDDVKALKVNSNKPTLHIYV